ncbi:Atu4866 domain-containing protein [Rhodocytophaga aerolata]|uniref:Atu4866 domain-containing protein n=1 Tax=Rhodocytophaga aerolata TaxID=455078 RepID=A0ABT8RF29_9BACT|nr:Atu4866 domain-containing protein [Rhodocytophaga aerolata]MDO1450710.1 Atu4866 domain-containing protein [Rhodocytophaga aerolata]
MNNKTELTVLITGVSLGMGLHIAQTLALQGHKVYTGIRDPKGRNVHKSETLQEYLFTSNSNTMQSTIEDTKEYIGMWVTKDGNIRHELLPNNRYDEARGKRKSAYQGAYTVTGNHIYYKDDTGFTADGEFKEGVLYHAGMILYKEE